MSACPRLTHPPMSVDEPIGLLAGWGRFPLTFARRAREAGRRVVCVGLRGMAGEELAGEVWRFHWSSVARLGRTIRLFRREGVRRLVMAGKVFKADLLYRPWGILSLVPDLRTLRVWYSRRGDNKDDTLLMACIRELARDGLAVESALDFCPELLVKEGVLTRRSPTEAEMADVRFGWEVAKAMGGLDVGQSVAVKDRAVVAVEAIEGTDRMILRAGELCRRGGAVIVKVAKPQQDRRFDVPTVGCTTLEMMRKARARVLAVEAGQTILLDEAEAVALADRLGLTIVSLSA